MRPLMTALVTLCDFPLSLPCLPFLSLSSYFPHFLLFPFVLAKLRLPCFLLDGLGKQAFWSARVMSKWPSLFTDVTNHEICFYLPAIRIHALLMLFNSGRRENQRVNSPFVTSTPSSPRPSP